MTNRANAPPTVVMMKVTLLGTGSPIPDPNRAGPSTLVQAAGQQIVVDCGRGCVMRLAAAGVFPPFLSAVLLTHLHSDHISDLNDIVTSRWIMSPQPIVTRIYGPVGTQKVVTGLRTMLELDAQYRNDHHADLRSGPGMQIEVHEVSPGDEFSVGEVRVKVGRTDHRDPVHRRSDTASKQKAKSPRSPATRCRARNSTHCATAPTSTCRRCCGPTSSR